MSVQSRVIEIIGETLGVSKSGLSLDACFEDLGADSLDLFQIVSALEEEYDIEFDSEVAESLTTLGDAVEYIKSIME